MESNSTKRTTSADDDLSLEQAAQGFAAIGSEPRLEVLIALVRAGPEGLNVGDIQKRLGMAASTLTHHLRFLAAAGLIEQTKSGRAIRNLAAFERVEALAAYLLRECCADQATTGNAPHAHGQHSGQHADQNTDQNPPAHDAPICAQGAAK